MWEKCYMKTKPWFILIFLVTKASMCPHPPCRETEGHVTVLLLMESKQTECEPLPDLTLTDPPALSPPAAGTFEATCFRCYEVDG